MAAEQQMLAEVLTQRHSASRSAGGTSRACSSLQVATQQALTPGTHVKHEAWAQTEVERILEPLHMVPPPLSNATFEVAFMQLQPSRHGSTPQHQRDQRTSPAC